MHDLCSVHGELIVSFSTHIIAPAYFMVSNNKKKYLSHHVAFLANTNPECCECTSYNRYIHRSLPKTGLRVMINIDYGYYNNFFPFSIIYIFSFFDSETMCRLYTSGENNMVLSGYNSIVILVGTIFFLYTGCVPVTVDQSAGSPGTNDNCLTNVAAVMSL